MVSIFSLLDAYELDIIPLKKLLSLKNAFRLLRRRREWLSYLDLIFVVRVRRRHPSLRTGYRANLENIARQHCPAEAKAAEV